MSYNAIIFTNFIQYIYICDYISYRRDTSRENISENLLLKRLPLPHLSWRDRLSFSISRKLDSQPTKIISR